MIKVHEVRLRLKMGDVEGRLVEVPLEYRKGSYSGRYELYIDNVHVGWVVKHLSRWEAYISGEQSSTGWSRIAGAGMSRQDAVDWLLFRLADGARVNVLAGRAEEVYAGEGVF